MRLRYTKLKSEQDNIILIPSFQTIVKALNFLLGNSREKVCAYTFDNNDSKIGIIHRLPDGTFSVSEIDI